MWSMLFRTGTYGVCVLHNLSLVQRCSIYRSLWSILSMWGLKTTSKFYHENKGEGSGSSPGEGMLKGLEIVRGLRNKIGVCPISSTYASQFNWGEYTWNHRNLNTYLSCQNFFFPFFCANTFDTSLLLIVCTLRWYVKSLYRHLFLEDISKHARVTQKMALPSLCQI